MQCYKVLHSKIVWKLQHPNQMHCLSQACPIIGHGGESGDQHPNPSASQVVGALYSLHQVRVRTPPTASSLP